MRITTLALGVAAPSLVSIGPVRAALTPLVLNPRFSGISTEAHVALTFDDGPDSDSTPQFLDLLGRYGVRATFFLLGEHVAAHEGLVREMAAAGHELAVHGWDHRPVLAHSPQGLRDGIARTRDLIEELTQLPVRHYRPTYGLVAPHSWWASRSAHLETVLWTAWGRDWEHRATPERVIGLVGRTLRPGGTVLLHDSDRTSAPGSWRTTLAATGVLLERWASAGQEVGPLTEHWSARP